MGDNANSLWMWKKRNEQYMRMIRSCGYVADQIHVIRPDKRCKTSRVVDQDGVNYSHYGGISRGEELAYLTGKKKGSSECQDQGPSTSGPPPDSQCLAEKNLDEPRINSSRFEGEALQKLISELAEVPMAVERAIRSGTNENSKEHQHMLRVATKKLNIQPSKKMYRDLLEISVVPEVNLKRIVPKEKKVDPCPVLEDYFQFKFSQIEPYCFAHTLKQSREPCPTLPNMCDDNLNCDYDIIGMERMLNCP